MNDVVRLELAAIMQAVDILLVAMLVLQLTLREMEGRGEGEEEEG